MGAMVRRLEFDNLLSRHMRGQTGTPWRSGIGLVLAGCGAAPTPMPTPGMPTPAGEVLILAIGDSLTEGPGAGDEKPTRRITGGGALRAAGHAAPSTPA